MATATAQRDDAQLIEGILAGDSSCFDELHGRYRDRIYRFAVKRMSDPVEAEDVVQEVFFQVYRCLASFEGRSSLLSWMFGIAHHQVCRRFRSRAPLMDSLDADNAVEIAAPQIDVDRQIDAARALEACVQTLDSDVSEGQQNVFRLRYAENQSTREIAENLGKSTQAVKISLFRTRRALEARNHEVELLLAS